MGRSTIVATGSDCGEQVITPGVTLPPYLQRMIEKHTFDHKWWDKTHNPFRGCTRFSPGCFHCWMHELIEARLGHQIDGAYSDFENDTVVFVPEALKAYARDLTPKRYFTPSMSDPFHEGFTDEMVLSFFEALFHANWHWYFVLTKRSERLASFGQHLNWPNHVMAVVSVEDEKRLHRIDHLRACGAKRIGVSFEPLIERLPVSTPEMRERYIRGLDYAIIGGESADDDEVRPMDPAWARELVEACLEEDVPVFFKQWGSVDQHGAYLGRKRAGRLLDGRTHDDLPRGCAEHLGQAQALAAAEKIQRRSR